ncbi:rapamycin-insensitive companion of mTOR [Episyrphus balteatus]|uniref:rapamycin-insensitive companion of mTOR n=1 Tax=Episyrphus balteatus TaxID=286459 RepID=UPI002486B629|nr:rapamycin-insensitive companion of mTOR [Episyrphus balteatus]
MASSWRIGKRKFRAKVSTEPEDYFRLDPQKSPAENAFEIYESLCIKETRDAKRLFLLNGFATLFQENKISQLGFTTEEFLYCLSVSLIHSFTQVRAAGLRAIRYVLLTPKDIKIFNSLQLPYLVCRSIDVLLRNDDERVQGLKLVRKILAISPEDVSPVIVRCLVSLANNGIEDSDNMLRACLATLCEFGVLNPTLMVVCGGVGAITRNVLECHNPRIAESLCGVLLHLLEWPNTRNISGIRLDCLAAPYCDFTYRLGIMDKNKDARELRYTSSRLALLSVLRSWAGTLEFCNPSNPSGLKAIVDVLYLNQLEVRKAILDLLYELLGLPQPIWTDEYSVALSAVDPSDFQDTWLLSNGFVAMEGRSILPSLASRAPNICEQHLALLLYCFLETGLLNALVEVIVSSDTFISVRATVLIGKILHLMHTHLPADICSTYPALPTLVTHATQGNHQATASISALQNYHQMLRNRPVSCSLFLDSIIQGGALINTRLFKRDINNYEVTTTTGNAAALAEDNSERRRLDSVSSSISGGGTGTDESHSLPTTTMRRSSFRLKKKKFRQFFENMREFNRLAKDSNVLVLADGNSWDWEIVTTILRTDAIGKLDDSKTRFLKRIVHYFKPSSNRFSHQDLAHGRTVPAYVTAGLDLIDWLLASNELESMRQLTDLFSDISQHLLAITTSNRAHDCLFSPQHMNNTMCQQYFLFIGRMCRQEKGISILTNTAVFEQLTTLVSSTDHVCYVKLIVSGLDYGLESYTRKILEKALTSAKTRSGRLYSTQFLLVLLRARIPNFEVWGIPLLINQTKDSERSIVLAAVDALDEACYEKNYLEELVSIWPNFKPLGDVGRLLMSRFYSIYRGLNHRKAKIKEEVEFWKNGYNKRYVLLVEADTHSSLTLHIKNEDGYYSRRNCSTRPIVIPPYIQPHLYGQLAQTSQGIVALQNFADLPGLVDCLNKAKMNDENDCLELKSALWALGHVSTHSNGIELFLESFPRIYEKIIYLATKAEVYSIRATAFSVLGLIGCTTAGANCLFKLNWLCVRHDRNTIWPVYQPEDWISNNFTPVRHPCEDVPSYNYPSLDDQIEGSYYTRSDWNLLLADDTTTTGESKGDSKDEIVGSVTQSKTMIEPTFTRPGKHTRSLSESKTTDVISLIAGTHLHHHRIRRNSCTDSNTSGVSSCESVPARTTVGDFQQIQLSPIPSMSNLADIPSRLTLPLRRTSIIGTSYLQTPISHLDFEGYAKLRTLRRHCRPVLSESAADEIAEIIDRNEIYATFRQRKSSISDLHRKIKVRSLDRHTSLNVYSQFTVEDLQVPLPTLAAPKFLLQNDSKGPCYSGICLPKHILDLFPTRNMTTTYVSRDIQDQDLVDANLMGVKQQFFNDSINECDQSSVISNFSDVSSVSKRSKWIGKHNRSNCLRCSRTNNNKPNKCSDNCLFNKKLKSYPSSSIQLSEVSFNSPESIHSEDSMPDHLTTVILYNVLRLANPVSSKQSKFALLELKQKQPESFQDICLYSEVCKFLGRSTYRMNARRFLQELFLDLNFESFNVEPSDIIARKLKESPPKPLRQITEPGEEISSSSQPSSLNDTNNTTPPQQQQQSSPSVTPTAQTPPVIPTNSGGGGGWFPSYKPNIKSPPLESVYETSCENLIESLSSKLSPSENQTTTTNSSSTTITSSINPSNSRNTTTINTTPLPLNNDHAANSKTNNIYESSLISPKTAVLKNDFLNSSTTITTTTNNTASNNKTIDNNCSCILTKQPAVVIENENKKFTRGRFYTLELDLSCTKNKFPITDRRKKEAPHSTTPTPTSTCPTIMTTTTTTGDPSSQITAIVIGQNQSQSQPSSTASTPITSSNTTNNPPNPTTTAAVSYIGQLTFTKSLAASLSKPIGSLYCEKRIQSSKSEAVLSKAKQT